MHVQVHVQVSFVLVNFGLAPVVSYLTGQDYLMPFVLVNLGFAPVVSLLLR